MAQHGFRRLDQIIHFEDDLADRIEAARAHARSHPSHAAIRHAATVPCSLPHRVRVVADVDDQQSDELGKLRADHERAQEDGPFDVNEVLRPLERGLCHSDAGWPRRQPPARTSTNWASFAARLGAGAAAGGSALRASGSPQASRSARSDAYIQRVVAYCIGGRMRHTDRQGSPDGFAKRPELSRDRSVSAALHFAGCRLHVAPDRRAVAPHQLGEGVPLSVWACVSACARCQRPCKTGCARSPSGRSSRTALGACRRLACAPRVDWLAREGASAPEAVALDVDVVELPFEHTLDLHRDRM